MLWAAGVPLGIDEELLREYQSPGWGSLQILLLALLCEATAIFTQVFVGSSRERVPQWIPVAGGMRVRPGMVVAVLLVPIVVLAGFNAWSLGVILDGFAIPEGNAGLPGWSFWGQVAIFWLWGTSLTLVTAAYCRPARARRPTGVT